MKLKRSKNKMIERFLQGFLIIILVILCGKRVGSIYVTKHKD